MKRADAPSSTIDLSSYSSTFGVESSSSTSSAFTDTVTVPSSAMVVVAVAGVPTVAVPMAVSASVRVTDRISPGSSRLSVSVAMAMVPLELGFVIVSRPLGAV